MLVTINGQAREVPDNLTVYALVVHLGLDRRARGGRAQPRRLSRAPATRSIESWRRGTSSRSFTSSVADEVDRCARLIHDEQRARHRA
jgi:hypothetical protein